MKYLIFLLMLAYFIPITNANFLVTRESASNINYGDILEVNISIFNNESSDKEVFVYEQVQDAEFIQPSKPSYTVSKNQIPFFKWQFSVPSEKIKVISYKIKPLTIGEYKSAPTKIVVDDKSYYSSSLKVKVNCFIDGVCSAGENFLNCREDCESGMEDGICDNLVEGRCDPDCADDSDCEEKKLNFFERIGLFFRNIF